MKAITLSLIIVALLAVGCVEEQEQTIKGINLTIQEYPKVDGSTSAHPLQVIVACKLLDVPYEWKEYEDMTKRVFPEYAEETKEKAFFINSNTTHHGTHDAYVNLIEKKADVILVARKPSPDELALAKQNHVEITQEPVAMDSFVFIVSKESPVEELSIEEIKSIYTGNITDWSEVGYSHGKIIPYQRNPNSGSQELMKELVMKDTEIMEGARGMILHGMMGPINYLSDEPNGIGYTVYFFEEFMAPNKKLKRIAINGVYPDYESIKTGKYPLTTKVFAARRADQPTNSSAYQLMEWLLTEEGQQVIKESGYIPINEA